MLNDQLGFMLHGIIIHNLHCKTLLKRAKLAQLFNPHVSFPPTTGFTVAAGIPDAVSKALSVVQWFYLGILFVVCQY